MNGRLILVYFLFVLGCTVVVARRSSRARNQECDETDGSKKCHPKRRHSASSGLRDRSSVPAPSGRKENPLGSGQLKARETSDNVAAKCSSFLEEHGLKRALDDEEFLKHLRDNPKEMRVLLVDSRKLGKKQGRPECAKYFWTVLQSRMADSSKAKLNWPPDWPPIPLFVYPYVLKTKTAGKGAEPSRIKDCGSQCPPSETGVGAAKNVYVFAPFFIDIRAPITVEGSKTPTYY